VLVISTERNTPPNGNGGGSGQLFLFFLLAKLTVKTGVDMKNNLTLSSSFQRSPLISAFFYPSFPIVLSIPVATKERDILDNPLTKEMLHEDSRFPLLFIQMPDPCSTFISVAFVLSFNCPCKYRYSIRLSAEASFKTSELSRKETLAKAC